jgi:hypothetical protein
MKIKKKIIPLIRKSTIPQYKPFSANIFALGVARAKLNTCLGVGIEAAI